MKPLTVILLTAALVPAGCGMQVDVTKTGKGYHAPTRPADVEVLMLDPTRPYVELGTVSVLRCDPTEIARMHNALRAKAAPLGAHAVVLINSGVDEDDKLWATGAAVRYTDQ
ncbi:MAG: hypothetical protein ACOC7R_03935 [Planctomycetota bacterium]